MHLTLPTHVAPICVDSMTFHPNRNRNHNLACGSKASLALNPNRFLACRSNDYRMLPHPPLCAVGTASVRLCRTVRRSTARTHVRTSDWATGELVARCCVLSLRLTVAPASLQQTPPPGGYPNASLPPSRRDELSHRTINRAPFSTYGASSCCHTLTVTSTTVNHKSE